MAPSFHLLPDLSHCGGELRHGEPRQLCGGRAGHQPDEPGHHRPAHQPGVLHLSLHVRCVQPQEFLPPECILAQPRSFGRSVVKIWS